MSKPGPPDQQLLGSMKIDFNLLLLAQPLNVPEDLIKGIETAKNLSDLKKEIEKFRENINKENQDLSQAFIQAANKLANDSLNILVKHSADVLLDSMTKVISRDEFDPVAALNNKDELEDPLAQLRSVAQARGNTASTTADTVQAQQSTQAESQNPSADQHVVIPKKEQLQTASPSVPPLVPPPIDDPSIENIKKYLASNDDVSVLVFDLDDTLLLEVPDPNNSRNKAYQIINEEALARNLKGQVLVFTTDGIEDRKTKVLREFCKKHGLLFNEELILDKNNNKRFQETATKFLEGKSEGKTKIEGEYQRQDMNTSEFVVGSEFKFSASVASLENVNEDTDITFCYNPDDPQKKVEFTLPLKAAQSKTSKALHFPYIFHLLGVAPSNPSDVNRLQGNDNVKRKFHFFDDKQHFIDDASLWTQNANLVVAESVIEHGCQLMTKGSVKNGLSAIDKIKNTNFNAAAPIWQMLLYTGALKDNISQALYDQHGQALQKAIDHFIDVVIANLESPEDKEKMEQFRAIQHGTSSLTKEEINKFITHPIADEVMASLIRNGKLDDVISELKNAFQEFSDKAKDIAKTHPQAEVYLEKLSEISTPKAAVAVQPFVVKFADQNGTISAKRQAQQIIEKFEKEIAAGRKVAITYSANSKQADDIYRGYQTGDFSIHGSNQAQVIKLVIEEIHKRKWEDKAHILPVATMSYDKKHNKQPVDKKSVKRDLGNIAQHVGAGWTVLGFQNQTTKPGELAVGGAISKEVWDEQKGLIREEKNKDYFDASMKKMLQGDYSGFEKSYNKGKENGVPTIEPSMAPVSKRTRAKTVVKGVLAGMRSKLKQARHSEQVPEAGAVNPQQVQQAPVAAALNPQPITPSQQSQHPVKPVNDAPSPHVKLPTFPPVAATETAAGQPSIVPPPPTDAQRAALVKPQGPPPTSSVSSVLQGEIKTKWTLQDDVYHSPPMSSGDLNKLVEKGLKNFEFERAGDTDKFIAKAPVSMVAELTQPTTAAPANPALAGLQRPPPLDTMRKHAASSASSSAGSSTPAQTPSVQDDNQRKTGPVHK